MAIGLITIQVVCFVNVVYPAIEVFTEVNIVVGVVTVQPPFKDTHGSKKKRRNSISIYPQKAKRKAVMVTTRVELATLALLAPRSNQLS